MNRVIVPVNSILGDFQNGEFYPLNVIASFNEWVTLVLSRDFVEDNSQCVERFLNSKQYEFKDEEDTLLNKLNVLYMMLDIFASRLDILVTVTIGCTVGNGTERYDLFALVNTGIMINVYYPKWEYEPNNITYSCHAEL